MSKRYTLTLSDHLADKLEEIAEQRDKKVQELMRDALRAFVLAIERRKQ